MSCEGQARAPCSLPLADWHCRHCRCSLLLESYFSSTIYCQSSPVRGVTVDWRPGLTWFWAPVQNPSCSSSLSGPPYCSSCVYKCCTGALTHITSSAGWISATMGHSYADVCNLFFILCWWLARGMFHCVLNTGPWRYTRGFLLVLASFRNENR